MNDHVMIIAEAGVNHNGSLDMALRLVDAAAEAGADAVKFQTFKADALVTRTASKAEYQKQSTGGAEASQWELLKALELDETAHQRLVEHCRTSGIEFLSTPFDVESAHFLVEALGVARIKISSGDLTNAPFLHHLAAMGRPLILSSGMALLSDIEQALSVIAHALAGQGPPSRDAFRQAYGSAEGQAALARQVSLLHCTTEYPASADMVNLRAMDTLRDCFGLVTGYSDHTLGIEVALAAAARGAKIIEKHFTLDANLPGPDHRASLEPSELKALVSGIRRIEEALGSPRKRSLPAEERNRQVATKSIMASRAIRAGEAFTAENLTVKRPQGGPPPVDWWDIIGREAQRDYAVEEFITFL
jgi:N-acetylneuraminate synthase